MFNFNNEFFTVAGYVVIGIVLLYLFFQRKISALRQKLQQVQIDDSNPFTPDDQHEAEELERIKNKLLLDDILGLDEMLDIYAKQRVDLLNEQSIHTDRGQVVPIALRNKIKVNKSVLAWINLLRIIMGTRIGRKLCYHITGGYINLKAAPGDQGNNRRKTHRRDNGKIVGKR